MRKISVLFCFRAEQPDLIDPHGVDVTLRRKRVRHDAAEILKFAEGDDRGAIEFTVIRHEDGAAAAADDDTLHFRFQIGRIGQTVFQRDAGRTDKDRIDRQPGERVHRCDVDIGRGVGIEDAAQRDDIQIRIFGRFIERAQRVGNDRHVGFCRQMGEDRRRCRAGVDEDGGVIGNQLRGQTADLLLFCNVPAGADGIRERELHMLAGLDRNAAIDLFQRTALQQLPDIPANGIHRDTKVSSKLLQRSSLALDHILLDHVQSVNAHVVAPFPKSDFQIYMLQIVYHILGVFQELIMLLLKNTNIRQTPARIFADQIRSTVPSQVSMAFLRACSSYQCMVTVLALV